MRDTIAERIADTAEQIGYPVDRDSVEVAALAERHLRAVHPSTTLDAKVGVYHIEEFLGLPPSYLNDAPQDQPPAPLTEPPPDCYRDYSGISFLLIGLNQKGMATTEIIAACTALQAVEHHLKFIAKSVLWNLNNDRHKGFEFVEPPYRKEPPADGAFPGVTWDRLAEAKRKGVQELRNLGSGPATLDLASGGPERREEFPDDENSPRGQE
jgi:hypothetical protein